MQTNIALCETATRATAYIKRFAYNNTIFIIYNHNTYLFVTNAHIMERSQKQQLTVIAE